MLLRERTKQQSVYSFMNSEDLYRGEKKKFGGLYKGTTQVLGKLTKLLVLLLSNCVTKESRWILFLVNCTNLNSL